MKKVIPKIAAIIQARMGSTRLPGKVLMNIGDETILARVVRRLSRSKLIDEILVATTTSRPDDAIVEECERLRVRWFRGSEYDVLDRYCRAAEAASVDIIVRITADCPLIDCALVDQVLRAFFERNADFACNVLPRTYPRGLDTEVFTRDALAKVVDQADQPYQREHVTPVFYERRDVFRFATVTAERDYSHYRWTVDTSEDLEFVRSIYSRFDNRDDFGWGAAIELLEFSPELAMLNAHVQQKEAGPTVGNTTS